MRRIREKSITNPEWVKVRKALWLDSLFPPVIDRPVPVQIGTVSVDEIATGQHFELRES